MFAGHVGAALALGRTSRQIHAGILIFAALALDRILWILVLAGFERVDIPTDFARRHYLVFTFPHSHGLLASLGWSALGAGVAWWATRSWESKRGHAAAVVATAGRLPTCVSRRSSRSSWFRSCRRSPDGLRDGRPTEQNPFTCDPLAPLTLW